MGKDVQPLQSVKTSILAEHAVRSGLGDIYIKMMNLLLLTPFLGTCLGSVEYKSAGQGKGSWSAGKLPMKVVADEETAGCG